MSAMPTPPNDLHTTPFDPAAPLPVGVLSIEASAGTGKTYTLSGLATRFLATGEVAAADLLLVTFTRAATGELRSRVRSRVAEAADHLDGVLAAGTDPTDAAASASDTSDELLTWLTTADAAGRPSAGELAPRAVLEARHAHLSRALAEFDAATITTIHGFAAQVLTALGVSTGVATDVTFVEDADRLLLEACSDVLARAAVDPSVAATLPTWDTLTKRVKSAMASADIVVGPDPSDDTAKPADLLLAQLVCDAVALMRARRRESGTQSFDDLLSRLRDALAADHAGAAAAAAGLRGRFKVALIDEFQDTDPVQWEIFRTLFAPGSGAAVDGAEVAATATGAAPGTAGARAALVLVGDPKQAIYSFRGADVTTYVAAVTTTPALDRRTLATNWRSDRSLLTAAATLFDGVTFGLGIAFSPVAPSPHAGEHGLCRSESATPVPAVEIRCGTSPDLCDAEGKVAADVARAAAVGDLVAHAVDLLENCDLPDTRPGTAPDSRRPVRPNDIAVLVRANSHAEQVQSALLASGVPAVLARGQSVVKSPAAEQLRFLLEALVRPSDPRRARTFAMSWFGGWTPAELDAATDTDIVDLQEQLHQWNALLTTRGVVEFLRAVWDQSGVVPRALTGADGDRNVTDLEHLGELLRLAVGDTPVSSAGLLGALDDLAARVEVQADTDRDTDISSRRVESDADAVQIMTVWVAKGLEFPIVMCPTLWSRPNHNLDYHDPDTGERVVDVRTPTKLPAAAKRRQGRWAAEESAAEDLRLLYVALTRARHHTAVWWAEGRSCSKSALAKVLFARDPHTGAIDPVLLAENDLKDHLPERADTVARLTVLQDLSGGSIAVRSHGKAATPPPQWSDPHEAADKPPLSAAEFTRGSRRPLDRSRSRWSFTAVVARDNTHGDPWDLTIDDEGADDEQRPPDVGLPESAVGGAGSGEPAASGPDTPEADADESPLAWLPAGAAFGTITHDVLERVDFTAEDLPAEVAAVVAEQQRWRSLSLRPVGHTDPPDPATPGAAPETDSAAQEELAEAAGAALLTAGLVAAIHTPLGPLFRTADGSERTLRHIAPFDRLDEMSFELNLAPGQGEAPTDAAIGAVLLEHLAADDPFRPWAEHLASGIFAVELAGHLTGSIDAVIRLREPDTGAGTSDSPAPDRFVVVDYKTNRLHPHAEPPTPGDYGAASIRRSMMEHHYPLQALLYSVALHRYLRWRLADYDPAVHLGGAAYLFVRGMTGPGVRTVDGHPDGVCSWAVPPAAVTAVSDLLAGARAAAGLIERDGRLVVAADGATLSDEDVLSLRDSGRRPT